MDPCTMIAAGAGAAVAVVAAPVVLAGAGFTAGGIAAGSIASTLMSAAAVANGGGVAAGGVVAALQAAGAAGIPIAANAVIGAIGATVGGAMGGTLICSAGAAGAATIPAAGGGIGAAVSAVAGLIANCTGGKPEPSERRRFARLILSVVSPYFFPPYTFQIRVGGLFLLYGLFNSQLVTPREKIRISLKDWKDVMQFQRDAVNAQHYDVVYIFRKLLTDKAFYFTAMPIPLFYREKKEDGRKMKICEEFVDPSSRPQELVTTDMLEEIANIHEHYESLKKSVFAEPDPNLDLIQKNLVPKLNGAILTYSSWQWNRTDSEQQDGGEGPSNQESSRRAQLLASIKSKSYGQAVEASKSRRHRQTQLVPAAEAEFSQKVTSKKKRKPSLKTRTQYLLNTQGNESEGLNVTRVWCMSAVKEEKAPEKRKKKFNWNPEKSSDPT